MPLHHLLPLLLILYTTLLTAQSTYPITPKTAWVTQTTPIFQDSLLLQDTLALLPAETVVQDCHCAPAATWCSIQLAQGQRGKIKKAALALFARVIEQPFPNHFLLWSAYGEDNYSSSFYFLATLPNGGTTLMAIDNMADAMYTTASIDSILDITGDGYPEIIFRKGYEYEEGSGTDVSVDIFTVLPDTVQLIFEEELFQSGVLLVRVAVSGQHYITLQKHQILVEYVAPDTCANHYLEATPQSTCWFHYMVTHTWNPTTHTYDKTVQKKAPKLFLPKGTPLYSKASEEEGALLSTLSKSQQVTVLQLTSLTNYDHFYPLYIQTKNGQKGYVSLHPYQLTHTTFDWWHKQWEDFLLYKVP